MRNWTHAGLVAGLMTALLAGCGADKVAETAGTVKTVKAGVQEVRLASLPQTHATPGTVVAVETASVASRLMGQILAIDVVEGQAVKAGQRLFTVDPADVRAQAAQAEAALADAKANYERFANLYKEEAVSRQQMEKMKLAYDQARASAESARNQLRYAVVTSPISGVVTQKLANAGSLAVPGQPVVVVENPARLQIQTQVGESLLNAIRPGSSVPVEIAGRAGLIEGRVAQVSPAADPVSRTFLVKLDLAGEGLRSGQFGRVLFRTGERQAVLVPKAALIERAGIPGVFVVDAQGIARFRMVRSGAEHDGQIEIQAGLKAGERVVVQGAEGLETGNRVAG